MNIKHSLSLAIKDRSYVTVWLAGFGLLVLLVVIGAIYIRPTDLQVPVRYSSFGITNFYREKWFYELNFIVFGILVSVFHSLIGLRFFEQRGRGFALAFQWLTVLILIIALATIITILRVVSLSQ
jgi:hypothetical protein